MIIKSATITIHGDPTVGIHDHQIEVNHLDLDLNLFDDGDRDAVIGELRERLINVGKIVGCDDNVSVDLHETTSEA